MSTVTAIAGSAAIPSLGDALDRSPMTRRHVDFWLLAALGVMLDGFDFFIIGVAGPLIKVGFGASDAERGLVSAAAIVGAVFGAGVLGPIADKVGRRRIFKLDLWLFVIFSVACIFAWDIWSLMFFRFMLGLAIGLDYPIAASYLAEVLPAAARGKWLVGAFSLQAVGIVMGAAIGVVVLSLLPVVDSWRIMLGLGIVPALVIIFLRRRTPESPRWLAQNGQPAEAAAVAEQLVGHPVVVTAADQARTEAPPQGLKAFFQPQLFSREYRRRTIFTAVPWFLMDIATYGVGIFTPTLLAALAVAGANATFMADDIVSTQGTALLDGFLIVGFVIAILLVDRVGRVPLQLVGFAVMAGALVLLAFVVGQPGGGSANLLFVFLGFMFFNTFMNAGPNATTYALPAEVFPSEIRAAGHGFAAASAKLGAAIGVFLFPILQVQIGTSALLYLLAAACLMALVVTFVFRIEPRGRGLDEMGPAAA